MGATTLIILLWFHQKPRSGNRKSVPVVVHHHHGRIVPSDRGRDREFFEKNTFRLIERKLFKQLPFRAKGCRIQCCWRGRGWRSQVGPDLLASPLLRAAVFRPRETDVGACAQARSAIVDLLATQASSRPVRLRQQMQHAGKSAPVGAVRADDRAIDDSQRAACLGVGLGCSYMQ